MKLKSYLTSLLVCATLLTSALPALAATSSFQDIQDPTTAANADVLRLMGAVSGSGNNQFSPDSTLTRAEFCVMAVHVMGKANQVPLYTTRTIFQDVTAHHWARGFINLASSTTFGAEESKPGNRLISGTGNGKFLPDENITFAQAVTILMRMLGYQDSQVGAVWPAGYLNLAQSLSLTANLSLSPNAPITRAQAAQLFVNLLSTKTASGSPYYASLGSPEKNVILLAVNVNADDNTPGAIYTSKGTFLPANQGVSPTALLGRRGTLILNDHNEIVTFIPDVSTSLTIILSGNAKANRLTATNGTSYSISPTTPVYTGSTANSTYSDTWVNLYSGTQVTLFLDGGKVIGLYCGFNSSASQDAVILNGRPSHAAFSSLTGGVENYTIKKHNQPIHMSDIQPFDVVTYDSVHNTLIVSDLRLTCVYESAQPSTASPDTIHALGHDFPVLNCALESVQEFTRGEIVTMLLTADGRIAGLAKPSPTLRATAMGLAAESSVDMFLPSGGTLSLTSSKPLSGRTQNQIVSFSSSSAGVIQATAQNDRVAPGDFDLINMTLGKYTVSASVSVFERAHVGATVPISISDLTEHTISAADIAYYHYNTSGIVDIIVLNTFTGNSYEYGRYTIVVEERYNSIVDDYVSVDIPYFETPQNGKIELSNHHSIAANYGDFIGIILNKATSGNRVFSYIPLTEIKNVSRSSFIQSQGRNYVEVNGVTYLIAENVEGYNETTKLWFTDDDVLTSIRAYSDTLTLYIDPIGDTVRIITTK